MNQPRPGCGRRGEKEVGREGSELGGNLSLPNDGEGICTMGRRRSSQGSMCFSNQIRCLPSLTRPVRHKACLAISISLPLGELSAPGTHLPMLPILTTQPTSKRIYQTSVGKLCRRVPTPLPAPVHHLIVLRLQYKPGASVIDNILYMQPYNREHPKRSS